MYGGRTGVFGRQHVGNNICNLGVLFITMEPRGSDFFTKYATERESGVVVVVVHGIGNHLREQVQLVTLGEHLFSLAAPLSVSCTSLCATIRGSIKRRDVADIC